MTEEFLAQCLAEGLSLEEIGRKVGRHASTVAYHLKKHGLEAVHREQNAPKGALGSVELRDLIDQGLSWAEIARSVNRSKTTVRYWLKKHELWPLPTTGRRGEALAARRQGLRYTELVCRHHGRTRFILENRGYYRCMRCRQERVSAWRRRAKRRLIEEAGERCAVCGYSAFQGALQFHHLNPEEKEFTISRQGVTRAFAELKAEARKCVLLCANCHAEVEGGYTRLPARS